MWNMWNWFLSRGRMLCHTIIAVCRQTPTFLETESASHPSTRMPGTLPLTPVSQHLLRSLSIKWRGALTVSVRSRIHIEDTWGGSGKNLHQSVTHFPRGDKRNSNRKITLDIQLNSKGGTFHQRGHILAFRKSDCWEVVFFFLLLLLLCLPPLASAARWHPELARLQVQIINIELWKVVISSVLSHHRARSLEFDLFDKEVTRPLGATLMCWAKTLQTVQEVPRSTNLSGPRLSCGKFLHLPGESSAACSGTEVVLIVGFREGNKLSQSAKANTCHFASCTSGCGFKMNK